MSKYFDFTAQPKTAWITVNRACNFRCEWCYAKNTSYLSDDNMPLDMAKHIVDIATDIGVKNIVLTGGEPTMWDDLFELSDYIRGKGLSSGLITNAYLFSNDSFWKSYQEHPFDSIRISIKGVTERQMSEIAGVGKLCEKTLLGAKRAISLNSNVDVGTVYSELVPVDDIKEMAKVSQDLGAKSFSLAICLPTVSEDDNSSTKFVSSQQRLANDLIDLHGYLDDLYSGEVMIDQSFPLCYLPNDFVRQLLEKDQLGGMCHVQSRTGLSFNTNGDVLLCNTINNVCIVDHSDYSDGTTLMKCLNERALKDECREILRYPSKVCSNCSYNNICRGGCLMNWTHLDPDIVCQAIV